MTLEARHAEETAAKAAAVPPADTLSPADRYQELFTEVQHQRVFTDSKTFVDCAPLADPEVILDRYRSTREEPGFDLSRFVHEHFEPEHPRVSEYVSDQSRTLVEHIDSLWEVLTRQPRQHPKRSSLLPLPLDYVVPGGRFREMYYWDSYFTMLGLADSGRIDLLTGMVDNFAYLIDTFGHVPNGNRSYYLSRSQPPTFALMTQLLEAHGGDASQYRSRLLKEYAFWMDGADDLRANETHRHCVRLPDGSLLNRYWDDRDTPREESFHEDVTTAAAQTSRGVHLVYRELRAAAESGWDFSSRWCDEPGVLPSIRTTSMIPVDLNAFLYTLESQIAMLSARRGDDAMASEYRDRASARCAAIDRWLWDDALGAYLDYDWERDAARPLCAATVTPLFVGIASREQAARLASAVRGELVRSGGLDTSSFLTGEQWDQPNGWAPLQWMAIQGFDHYGEHDLAHQLSDSWLGTVSRLYEREGKLVEKYDLRASAEHDAAGGGGGEYPLQDGFGWTNGVTRTLLTQEHDHAAQHARGRSRVD